MCNKLIGFLIVLLFVPGAFAQGLFQEPHNSNNTDEQPKSHLNSMTIRSRQTIMDSKQLFPPPTDNGTLTLNLFSDAEFKAAIDNAQSLPTGGSFISGALENGGRMTLFVSKEGIVRGEVHSPRGIYTIRSSAGHGNITIRQMDVSSLPPADHGAVDMRTRDIEKIRERRANQRKLTLATGAQETELPPDETVDILVVYTLGAQSSEGGKAGVEATIIAEVEKANLALENSGLGHRKIRLVGMEKVNYAQSPDYIEDDLAYLVEAEEVHELRDQYAADMVHLFVSEPARDSCGIATIYALNAQRFVEDSCYSDSSDSDACIVQLEKEEWLWGTFSLSAISGCLTSNIFTHELGHSFGIYHDRYVVSPLSLTDPIDFPLRPYAFGYVNQNFSRSSCYSTIMAYAHQCVDEGYSFDETEAIRALMFSNPDLELGSEEAGFDSAGVPGEEQAVDLGGPANASRAVDDVWDTVANLYHSSTSCSGRYSSASCSDRTFCGVPDSIRVSSSGDTETYTISSDDSSDSCSADDLNLTAESDRPFIITSVESKTVTDGDGNERDEYDVTITVRANNGCGGRTGSANFGGDAGISHDVSIGQDLAVLCSLISDASSTSTSQETLASLDFSNEGVDHVAGFLFVDLADLTGVVGLDLSDNDVRALPANAFARTAELEDLDDSLSRRDQIHLISNNRSIVGLVNLKNLDLSGNLVERLSTLAFGNLFRLKKLDLSRNRLKALPRDVFSDLLELEDLSLSDNQIRSLRADLLARTVNLEELNASKNQIGSLSADIFDSVPKLRELDLSGNQIANFPTDVFSRLTEIEYLWLHDNNLSNIAANAFARLTSLRGLSLDGNAVEVLSANAFANTANLEYLWLSADEAASLPSNLFFAPVKLKYLSLSANSVASLPGNLFSRLTELQYLNLSVNEVRTLPSGLFARLADLRYLRLSGEGITSLPASVCSFVNNVKYAGVSGFELSSVCPSSGAGVSMASFVSGLMGMAGDGVDDNGSNGVSQGGAGLNGAGFQVRGVGSRPYNQNVVMKMYGDNLDLSGISSLTGYDESAVSYTIRTE